MRSPSFALALTVLLAAPAARAGEAACWFEGGVVVVPAQVMGVAGDFVLDTATAHTTLADTQAQGAGFSETALHGEVRLAGVILDGQPVAVANLDLRTGGLPTPVAGVIGADVLRGFVVDMQFAPCRVALWPAAGAPPFRATASLALDWTGGTPTVPAAAFDGARTVMGPFAVAVGGDTAVRLADDLAAAPGAPLPRELYPGGVGRPTLTALSFAGVTWPALPAGLLAAAPDEAAGQIGTPVLARYRLRFDFPAGRLRLIKAAPP